MKEFKNYVDFKPGVAVKTYWDSLGVKEEEVLFVDIETTGLSSKRDAIYQIGLAYKEGASWLVLQWLCERRSEERELLQLFFRRLGGYRLLMHFNGTTFDLPFIRQRALKYKNHFPGFGVRKTDAGGFEHPMEEESEHPIEEGSEHPMGKERDDSGEFRDRGSCENPSGNGETRDRASGADLSGNGEAEDGSEIEQYTPLDNLISADMFRIFSPLASFLGLPNKKQKSFEAFLGIDREDELSGGDLIPVYCEYETTGDERLEHYLMIHNHEDMKGMLRLTELFAYRSLREGNFEVRSFSIQEDHDFAGRTIHELTAKLRLDAPVTKRFFRRGDGFYFEVRGTTQPAQTVPAAGDDAERIDREPFDGRQGDGTTQPAHTVYAVEEGAEKLTDRRMDGVSGLDEAADGTSATAVIRLEEGVMKHFFANYRDYDYLIKEDMAVYRTVGDLVDPSLRKRATAETCYVKREGLFLSVGADCAAPLFRRTYKSKDVYVLAGEDLDLGTVKSAVRKGLG